MINVVKIDNIWRITLSRAEKANALTSEMLLELIQTFADAHGQASVVILSSAGKVFSAGADLEEAKTGLATSELWEILSAKVAALPCFTIAALNGTAAGGSLGMVLACDIRLATVDAKFFYPVMRLGFLPQPSDVKRLVSMIGASRTKLILLGGQRISADEALDWGLIDRITTHATMEAEIQQLTGDCLRAKPGHAEAIKSMIRRCASDL